MTTLPKSIADRLMSALGSWVVGHMDMLFGIARNLFPILLVKYKGNSFALVTRFADVQEVLQRPNVFDVIYAPKIRVLMDGDNIFLGMSDKEPATRDKTTMRLTAPRWEVVPVVRPQVEKLARDAVAIAGGRIDIAMSLVQSVTTEFLCRYFGTPSMDSVGLSNDARLLFKFMFVNMNDDPALLAQVMPVSARMRAFVESKIVDRKLVCAGSMTTCLSGV
jgi:cytochrome P450